MMTSLINEAPLHRRKGTRRSPGPPRPSSPGDVTRWPLSRRRAPLPTGFPHPGPISAWQPAQLGGNGARPPGSAQPPQPPQPPVTASSRGGRAGARRSARPRPRSSRARAYLAKSRANPEQLRVPADAPGAKCTAGPESGNTRRALPGVGRGSRREFAW